MRNLLLLLIVCTALPAWAQIAYVNGVKRAAADGTTSAIDTTGATLIVIVSKSVNNAGTFTDARTGCASPCNTWTAANPYLDSTSNGIKIWYAVNPTVGAGHTFTGANSTFGFYVMAFSGTATTSPLGQQNGAGYLSVTSAQPGTGITPTTNGQVIICGLTGLGGTSRSIDSGFTIPTGFSDNFAGGANYAGGAAYLIQTAATAVNPTWSWTSTTTGAVNIASFKAAGATGTVRHRVVGQ